MVFLFEGAKLPGLGRKGKEFRKIRGVLSTPKKYDQKIMDSCDFCLMVAKKLQHMIFLDDNYRLSRYN